MPAFSNRFEIKYLTETARIPEVRACLGGFFDIDANGDRDGTYLNHSIYFDSAHYRFYAEKREGELVRIKPRIRFYRACDDGRPLATFLELKGRYDRIVEKRRCPISEEVARTLLHEGPGALGPREMENSVMAEFAYLYDRYALAPRVTVVYYRSALNGLFQHDLRLTFDQLLRCSLSTDMDLPSASLVDVLPPTSTIIELKYNDDISAMLLQRLRSLGLRQQTLSKYALAMEEAHENMRRNMAAV